MVRVLASKLLLRGGGTPLAFGGRDDQWPAAGGRRLATVSHPSGTAATGLAAVPGSSSVRRRGVRPREVTAAAAQAAAATHHKWWYCVESPVVAASPRITARVAVPKTPPTVRRRNREPPQSARESVEQAEAGIHRATSYIDQLLIFRRVVPLDDRLTVGKPHECP